MLSRVTLAEQLVLPRAGQGLLFGETGTPAGFRLLGLHGSGNRGQRGSTVALEVVPTRPRVGPRTIPPPHPRVRRRVIPRLGTRRCGGDLAPLAFGSASRWEVLRWFSELVARGSFASLSSAPFPFY